MKSVKVYTTDYCPYCRAAMALLQGKGVPFEEINVEGNDKIRKWLVQATGQKTVPQIFIEDQSIGGFQELEELDRQDRLDQLLK